MCGDKDLRHRDCAPARWREYTAPHQLVRHTGEPEAERTLPKYYGGTPKTGEIFPLGRKNKR